MEQTVFSKMNELETACNNLLVSRNGAQPAPRWLFHYRIVHNHSLFRVVGRVHAQSTEDVRGQIGMPHISSFLFYPFFTVALWQNPRREKRSARTCTRSLNWSAVSKVFCRAGAALHSVQVTSVCTGSFQIFVETNCWFVDKQVDIVKESSRR